MENRNRLSVDEWEAIKGFFEETHMKDQKVEYWHYTSVNAVLGIFKEYISKCNDDKTYFADKCSMYASNIRFMNDAKEYNEGESLFEELSEGDSNLAAYREVSNDNIFLISFCENGDLLSQWKWYGKDSGISIMFNLEETEYCTISNYNDKGEKLDKQFWDKHTKPLSVKYKEGDKTNYYNKLMGENILKTSKAYNLIKPAFVPFCKDESFFDEHEHRLVFYTCNLADSKDRRPRFNIVYNDKEKGRIKPALDVVFRVPKEKKNVISRIMVGPGNNQEMVFNFLIHLFDRSNYFYHPSLNVRKGEEIKWNNFLHENGVSLVECEDGKKRICYKCENGIVIMKSAIPFRE